jgi:DNA-binding response OmpR family regulator
MSRILVVEDEQHLAEGLRFNLEAEGHSAVIAADGERALQLVLRDSERFDALVLDVMLPVKDGFVVATELRAAGKYMPILMLTARGRAEDVLRGFEAGADDYLAKPFELSILLARLSGLLRRSRWNEQEPPPEEAASDRFVFAGRTIDFAGMQLHSRGEAHPLTLMECELLRYLVRNAGQPVSRAAILENVWNLHEGTDTRAIDNFIVRLRRYIEDRPSMPRFLLTVRGVGYKFDPIEGARDLGAGDPPRSAE